jgi:hypothetical protein
VPLSGFFADFCEIFLSHFHAKENFSIGVKGTLHGQPLSRRMHERFSTERSPFRKEN